VLVLAVVVLFLVFSLFWAFSPKAPRAYEDYGGKADSGVITDQMTLLDVEKATGIPAKEIAEALGLPSKIPLNETLRQLRKSYPLTLQEVRNVVTELLNKKEVKIKEEVKPKELLHIGPNRRLVRGRMASVPSGILITGKMTLYDLEDITGIPARKIANELGIPSNALLNEHLGRLRRRYRFSMQEVRNVVASLMKKNRKKNKK
jgi:Mor family transcriptional regulator